MEEPPTPAILPPTNAPPVYGPVYSPGKTPKGNVSIPPKFLVIGILIIVIIGSILFAVSRQKPAPVVVAPTPTATPTPTPIRILSSFATQSAFLQFEQSVNALPATISGTNVSDQTLAPPSVDLSLGFQK